MPDIQVAETQKGDLVGSAFSSAERLLLQRGPLGILALAGTWTLGRGLFPSFELRQAVFGASLLVVVALSDWLVWLTLHRAAKKKSERAEQELKDTDGKAPTWNPHG